MSRPVLVVDDDAGVRRALVRELDAAQAVGSYDAAIRVLEAHGAELIAVVSDLQLGEPRTGLDLLREVATRWPHCARVLVSASLDAEAARLWEQFEGPERVFPKPWRVGEVLAAVLALGAAHELARLEHTTEFPVDERLAPLARSITPKR